MIYKLTRMIALGILPITTSVMVYSIARMIVNVSQLLLMEEQRNAPWSHRLRLAYAFLLTCSFRLDVRAMPFPRTTASSGDDSFNTERLDEQNSAENIRSSMQKYLQVEVKFCVDVALL